MKEEERQDRNYEKGKEGEGRTQEEKGCYEGE